MGQYLTRAIQAGKRALAVSVLASSAAVAQDIVLVHADRFVWAPGLAVGQDVQARVELSRSREVREVTVALISAQGEVFELGDASEPLMAGEMAAVVKEMETIAQRVRNGALASRLAALDDAERAVMKARRLLGARTRGTGRSADPELARATITSTTGVRIVNPMLDFGTPVQRAHKSFTWAVSWVRQAPDAEGAGEALHELERSISNLRVVFWDTQSRWGFRGRGPIEVSTGRRG